MEVIELDLELEGRAGVEADLYFVGRQEGYFVASPGRLDTGKGRFVGIYLAHHISPIEPSPPAPPPPKKKRKDWEGWSSRFRR